MVLGMMSLIVGLAGGGVGVLLLTVTDWYENFQPDENSAKIFAFM